MKIGETFISGTRKYKVIDIDEIGRPISEFVCVVEEEDKPAVEEVKETAEESELVVEEVPKKRGRKTKVE